MNSSLTNTNFKRGEKNPELRNEIDSKYQISSSKTKTSKKGKKKQNKGLKIQYLGKVQNDDQDEEFDLQQTLSKALDFLQTRDVDFFDIAFGRGDATRSNKIRVVESVNVIEDEMFPDLPVRDPSTLPNIRVAAPVVGKKTFVPIPATLLAQLDADLDGVKHYSRNEEGVFTPTTRGEFRETVVGLAKSLIVSGFVKGDRLCVMGGTSAKWCYTHLATQFCAGICAGIYQTNSPEQVSFIINNSGAKFFFVENAELLMKNEKVFDELSTIQKFVVMNGNVDHERAMTWEEFLAIGADTDETEMMERIDSITPEDCVTLIYTSGTTGPPKGVMLSSGNVTWVAKLLTVEYAAKFDVPSSAKYVSYLPLSHIAEQVFSVYGPSFNSLMTVYFCEDFTQLAATLAEVQPHMFFGAPRVYEKFFAGISAKLPPGVPLDAIPQETKQGIISAVGFGQLKLAITASAPISPSIIEFFSDLGLKIYELYGQSEGTGPTSSNLPGENKIGSVGRPCMETDVVIAEDGELLFRGPQVFIGYWDLPEMTAETLTEDGFVRSGDLARIDQDGFVYIIGRKKDIIITSGGKNITPINMENALKAHPLIGAAVVVGEGRPYLNALISIDHDVATSVATKNGISVEDFLAAPTTYEVIEAHINKINEGFNRQEQVKKFKLLEVPIGLENDTMTPTFKIKRAIVNQVYADVIDELYE